MKIKLLLLILIPYFGFAQNETELPKKKAQISTVNDYNLGDYYNRFKKTTFSDYQSECRSKPMGPIGYTFSSKFYEGNSLLDKMETYQSIYLDDYITYIKKIPYNVIQNNSSSSDDCSSELYNRKNALLDIYALESEMFMQLFNNEIKMRNDKSDYDYKTSLDSLNQVNIVRSQNEDRLNQLHISHDDLLEKAGILKLVKERDSKIEKLKIEYKNAISSLEVEENDKILSLPQKDFDRNKSIIKSKFYNLIRDKKNYYESQLSSSENFFNSKINILASQEIRNKIDEIAEETKQIEDFDYSNVKINRIAFDKQKYRDNADQIIKEFSPKFELVLTNYSKEQQKKERTKKIIGAGIGILGGFINNN